MAEPTEIDYGLDFQGRRRFYGIYSAVVLPGVDPLGRFRIKLLIPGPTGVEKTNWAKACLPVTDNSYHPDHNPHTASQIAALLTTTAVAVSGGTGGGTVPALTIVPIAATGQLNHAHTTTKSMVNTTLQVAVGAPTATTDTLENSKYTSASGLYAPGTTSTDTSRTTPEHTFHRTLPQPGQKIWVMFEAGDPEYPVWIGVQA
ncbi:hypothetical protein UFOVP27_83 [uncultured Caudovirales phage]|uniref:Uncharacterized protein n=1 Tax=uncultured Caudovirales phage TaxID=2100421 RepID=A0A6J5KLW8_9CAUD|nr:hypothetical protein UFOVP27_83 [uncultured Caudovirales phage]